MLPALPLDENGATSPYDPSRLGAAYMGFATVRKGAESLDLHLTTMHAPLPTSTSTSTPAAMSMMTSGLLSEDPSSAPEPAESLAVTQAWPAVTQSPSEQR